jgi:hypothetical protein
MGVLTKIIENCKQKCYLRQLRFSSAMNLAMQLCGIIQLLSICRQQECARYQDTKKKKSYRSAHEVRKDAFANGPKEGLIQVYTPLSPALRCD